VLYAILKPIVVVLMRLYFRVEARGAEHVPPAGPVLLVANHASLLDPPLVGGMSRRPLCFMAKEELFRVPILGWLIRHLNARPVRRDNADPRALKDALRVLQAGEALLVFPEGTRSADGSVGEAKPGAGLLAVASGAAVVPVYIRGSGHALPRGRLWPRPVKVVVYFGPALTLKAPPGDARRDHYRAAAGDMMRAIRELRDAA